MGGIAQILQLCRKRRRYVHIAVDNKNLPGLRLHIAQPLEQMVVIRMGAETLEVHDLRLHGDLLAEELDAVSAIQQMATERAGGLEAYEHHRVLCTPEIVLEMMADTTRVAHTGCGDDDLGGRVKVQCLGLLRGGGHIKTGEAEHGLAVLHQLQRLVVEVAAEIPAEHLGALACKGAIDIDREITCSRREIVFLDLADEVQNFLRASHRKGRDDHIAAPGDGLVDDVRQILRIALGGLMVAVAVGGFHDHIIRLRQRLGIADNGLIDIADVAGEQNVPGDVALGHAHRHTAAAKKMPRIGKADADALCQLHALAVLKGTDIFLHQLRICHGVQRLYRRTTRTQSLAVLILRVALLNMGGVQQHDLQQLRRDTGGADHALKAPLDQQRNASAVVNMSMRHDHIVDLAGMEGQIGVVKLVPSLLQTTVHKDFFARRLQHVAAARHAAVCAIKIQFHDVCSFP